MILLRVYNGPFLPAHLARIRAEMSALQLPASEQLIAQLAAPANTTEVIDGVRVQRVRQRELRRLVRESCPRVIYSHGVWSLLRAAVAVGGHRGGPALVYEIHGAAAFEALQRRNLRWLRFLGLYVIESAACLAADRLVLVSDAYTVYYPVARMRRRLAVPRIVEPAIGRGSAPADVRAFAARARALQRPLAVYAGSAAEYQLPRETMAFLGRLVREGGFAALVLTPDLPVFESLRDRETLGDMCLVTAAESISVAACLELCDLGVLLRANAVLNKVASPTKLYEYLYAGLAVAAAGVPEAQRIIARVGVGVVFKDVEIALHAHDAAARCAAALEQRDRIVELRESFTWRRAKTAFRDFVFGKHGFAGSPTESAGPTARDRIVQYL